MNYRNAVEQYIPSCEQEAAEQRLMLQWLDAYPESILSRSNEFAHATASAMIFDPTLSHVLMVYHNIYNSWSWTGGHADGEDDPFAVALREAKEETGLADLSPLSATPTGLDILTVTGHIKRGKWVAPHLHLSLCYSFAADPSLPLRSKPDENSGVQWLPVEHLHEYVSEPAMLPIYERILQRTHALER